MSLFFIAFLFGTIVGSFINVVSYRLPIILDRNWIHESSSFLKSKGIGIKDAPAYNRYETFNLLWPPSHCTHCKQNIKPWNNIPLVSYFMLKKHCSNCKKEISWRYPIVELISGCLTGLLAYSFELSLTSFLMMLFVWSLLTITIIDINHYLIPDELTLPLLWLGLFINALGIGVEVSLHEAIIGAICGYSSLWLINWIFKIIRKKEGMGHGDFKLFAAVGAWLGWQSLAASIIISSFIGAVSGVFMVTVLSRDKALPIPFGPYLAGAALIFVMWGTEINNFYLISVLG